MKKIVFLIMVLMGCNGGADEFLPKIANNVGELTSIHEKNFTTKEYGESGETFVFVGGSRIYGLECNKYFSNKCITISTSGIRSSDLKVAYELSKKYSPTKTIIHLGVGVSFESEKEIYDNLSRLFESSDCSKIYVTGAIPTVSLEETNANINEKNTIIKQACEDYGAIFINMQEMTESGALMAAYSYDGLHYNNAGYDKFFEIMLDIL